MRTITVADPNKRRRGVPLFLSFTTSILVFLVLVHIFDPSPNLHDHTALYHNIDPSTPLIQSVSMLKSNRLPSLWKGRERLYSMLEDAGLASTLPAANISSLPTQSTLDHHYGPDVVILGMDECPTYRSTIPLADRIIGVAGMFNTGTNLLDSQLRKNVHTPHPHLWQVPWGKHRMAVSKDEHVAPKMEKFNKTNVLPVVVIRHPLAWLASMCKSPYAAIWRHNQDRCPNLVATDEDHQTFPHLHGETFGVKVKFDDENQVHFDSLVHLWSEWYRQYLDAPYPILMGTCCLFSFCASKVSPHMSFFVFCFACTVRMEEYVLFRVAVLYLWPTHPQHPS